MRFATLLLSAAAASLLSIPSLAHADTVLVGSNLSTLSGGSVLCPTSSNCQQIAQQFTVFTPVVIDQIKVGMSGPGLSGLQGGIFHVSLGSTLGTGSDIGSGDLVYDSKGSFVTQVFNFSALNISLGAGTYFLQMSGGNVDWAFAAPAATGPGSFGPTWHCDPTLTCSSGRWDSLAGTYAMEIDGTATVPTPTPEPSSFALLGTGILGLAGAARRRLLHS